MTTTRGRTFSSLVTEVIERGLEGDVALEQNPVFSARIRTRHLASAWDVGQLARGLRREDILEAMDADERVAQQTRGARERVAGNAASELTEGLVNVTQLVATVPALGAMRSRRASSLHSVDMTKDALDDPVLSSNRRRHSTAFGTTTLQGHSLTFLTTIYCSAPAAMRTFTDVRKRIQAIAPRARVFGFAEVDEFRPGRLVGPGPFDGIIQVVPMYTVKQVSHSRVLPNCRTLQRIVDHPKFIVVITAIYVSVSIFFVVASRIPNPRGSLRVVAWVACGVQLIAGTMWMLQLSRPICKLLLSTYDLWLIVFWVILAMLTRFHTTTFKDQSEFLFANDVSFTFAQVSVLLLDAYPCVSRRMKGALFLIDAILQLYTYFDWWYARYTDEVSVHENISIFRVGFPLVLVAQSAALALFFFFIRLCHRCWFRKLDLAIVDFPVSVVPHHLMRQEEEDSSLHNGGDENDEGGGSTAVDDSINGSSAERKNNTCHLVASPKFRDSSESLARFEEERGTDPEELRRATRCSSSSRSASWSVVPPGQTMDHLLVLHVDGSLPCDESDAPQLLHRLEQSMAPDGHVDAHMVEPSCAFSPDRRTFLPESYMHSYSPLPVIRWEWMYIVMSKWWFPYVMLFVAIADEVLLAAVLNNSLMSMLWLHVVVRASGILLVVFVLLFGTSHALARDALKTLDFWLVIVSFQMQMVATTYMYVADGSGTIAMMHAALVSAVSLFFAFIDCLLVVSFKPAMKGVLGLLLGGYTVFNIFFLPALPNADDTVDLRFTVITPNALSQLSSLSLLILYLKIAARTLFMGSSLVYFQFGAVEEIVGEDGFINICSH